MEVVPAQLLSGAIGLMIKRHKKIIQIYCFPESIFYSMSSFYLSL